MGVVTYERQLASWSKNLLARTYPEEDEDAKPYATYIYPCSGYGAQGGRCVDLVHFFKKMDLGVIVNSSRGIIAAYQNKDYASYGEENFADASRAAVIAMKDDINEALGRKMI